MYIPFEIALGLIFMAIALLAFYSLPDWISYPLFLGLAVLGPWLQYRKCKKMEENYKKKNSMDKVQQIHSSESADFEKEFAKEYALYHLPDFVLSSLTNGTELIDFIYATARHFAEWGAIHLNARKEGQK